MRVWLRGMLVEIELYRSERQEYGLGKPIARMAMRRLRYVLNAGKRIPTFVTRKIWNEEKKDL